LLQDARRVKLCDVTSFRVRGPRLIVATAALFVALVATGPGLGAGSGVESNARRSPGRFVAYLARQPIRFPTGATSAYPPMGFVRGPIEQGRPQPPPKAVGVVLVGIHSSCCRGVGIQYTVYPDAGTARDWMFGPGPERRLSIWRLKQLAGSSLPHPRLAGSVPRYPTTSAVVESAGHVRLDRMGLTEADVLVGNVIANVTTYSLTSTQHGNRVATMQLIAVAVAHLRRAQAAFARTG
jgi:hypothetical protein